MFENNDFSDSELCTIYRALKTYECFMLYRSKPYIDKLTMIRDIPNIHTIELKLENFFGYDFNNFQKNIE